MSFVSTRQIEDKLKLLIFPHHRLDEVLRDFDKYKRGTIKVQEFISAIKNTRFGHGGFTFMELNVLSEKYTIKNSFNEKVIDYKSFIVDIQRIFESRKSIEHVESSKISSFITKERFDCNSRIESDQDVSQYSNSKDSKILFSLMDQKDLGGFKREMKRILLYNRDAPNLIFDSYKNDQPRENDRHHDRMSLLYKSCLKGMLHFVRFLLSFPGIQVNKKRKMDSSFEDLDESPLFAAISKNHIECVRELLSHRDINPNGIQHDFQNGYSDWPNPLLSPLKWSITRKKINILRELLKHPRLDVNRYHDENRFGCGYFLEDSCSFRTNYRGKEYRKVIHKSPLFEACMEGEIEIVRLLLSHHQIDINRGVEIVFDMTDYSSKFQSASKFYYQKVETPKNEVKKRCIWTPLYIASLKNHVEIVKLLMIQDGIDRDRVMLAKFGMIFKNVRAIDVAKSKEVRMILTER